MATADPTILVFAYACEPDKGSEPGAGWAWVRLLAQIGPTTVLTRANNRVAIEAALGVVAERESLDFHYIDLPSWARFWKRGQRGVRLYYMLWQIAAAKRARALARERRFDLIWHVTLANAWLGTLAVFLDGPFVYGPVGAGAPLAWRLLPSFGVRGAAYELLRQFGIAISRYANPLARASWRRADLILVQNPDTLNWLPARHRSKAQVFPNVALDEVPARTNGSRAGTNVALFAGRLVAFKGPSLAIRAIAAVPEWRLVVCGAGPQEQRLRRLVRQLGVADRVEFRGQQPREELLRVMREDAAAFIFPSVHDQAPWVVGEALLSGLPVVCLDSGGPPVLVGGAGIAVDAQGSQATVASRLAREGFAAVAAISAADARARGAHFLLDNQAARVRALLGRQGLLST
jgi:glycosyltransferase involved in cell wall biosynthesis